MKKPKKETAVESPAEEPNKALTKEEKQQLLDYENTIESSEKNYIVIGKALAGILAGDLYKETEKSFDRYCVIRWDFSGSHARRLIDAYELTEKLRTDGKFSNENLPRNEHHARLLRELRKRSDHWSTGWRDVLKEAEKRKQRVTAQLIEEVLAKKKKAKASVKVKPAKAEKVPPGTKKALELIESAEKDVASKSPEDWIKLLEQLKELLQQS